MPQNESMPENEPAEDIQYRKSPGIRVTADGQRIGAIYEVQCPELCAELLALKPLNEGWRRCRPAGWYGGDLKLTMLLRSPDPGQARLLAAYGSGETVALALMLPDGGVLRWTGVVRSLGLKAGHPDAPVSLSAALAVTGEGTITGGNV